MSVFAPTFTPRYRVQYSAAGLVHHIQLRGGRGTSFSDMGAYAGLVHNIFNAFAAKLPSDFVFIDAQIALTDSDIFNATAAIPSAVTGAQDPADYSPMGKATAWTWTGKSVGARARLSMYGIICDPYIPATPESNGAVTGSELAAVGTVAGLLTLATFAIDGTLASYPSNASVKVNDNLLSKVRKGVIS